VVEKVVSGGGGGGGGGGGNGGVLSVSFTCSFASQERVHVGGSAFGARVTSLELPRVFGYLVNLLRTM
jgi:hypothetical protein